MFEVLQEVLKDLFLFVREVCCGSNNFVHSKNNNSSDTILPFESNDYSKPISITNYKEKSFLEQVAYIKEDSCPCFSGPKLYLDTKVGDLTYGEKVAIGTSSANFFKFKNPRMAGWVNQNFITLNATQVFPEFEQDIVYNSNDNEVIKLRRFIHDDVMGGELSLPLQAVEFILYKLKYNGIKFIWPEDRPRSPGLWQKILRGRPHVSLSIEPRTGSILEYGGDDETKPFLAYVEAVHPDYSITIQSVSRLREGEFRIESFSKKEWIEWRPTFFLFS